MMKDVDQCDLAGGFLCFFLGRARKKKKFFKTPIYSSLHAQRRTKKRHPGIYQPYGAPHLHMKNGRDVAASSHFAYLSRQSAERGGSKHNHEASHHPRKGAANIVSRKRSKTALLRSDCKQKAGAFCECNS